MADAAVHPKAVEHLPFFITAPDQTDVLMVITAFFLAGVIVAFGVFYFRLHSLPEHVAHKGDKVQMEIVSILCLIALFTHMHIFWIAGLLLAFVDIPDFGTPLRRIAGSVARMAGGEPPIDTAEIPREAVTGAGASERAGEMPAEPKAVTQADGAPPMPKKPAVAAASNKEPSHA